MGPRARRIIERIGVGSAIVVVPATVLWSRQTPQAQLRVGSFGAAAAEVLFWSAPTIVVCILFLRTRWALVGGATAAVVALALVWWGSARDWHSTASWRPALTGWVLVPVGLLVLRFVEARLARDGAPDPLCGRG
jgi:hypothetical protein